jgi:hypothetical protein
MKSEVEVVMAPSVPHQTIENENTARANLKNSHSFLVSILESAPIQRLSKPKSPAEPETETSAMPAKGQPLSQIRQHLKKRKFNCDNPKKVINNSSVISSNNRSSDSQTNQKSKPWKKTKLLDDDSSADDEEKKDTKDDSSYSSTESLKSSSSDTDENFICTCSNDSGCDDDEDDLEDLEDNVSVDSGAGSVDDTDPHHINDLCKKFDENFAENDVSEFIV